MTASVKLSLAFRNGLSFHNLQKVTPNLLGISGSHQGGTYTNAVRFYRHRSVYPMMKELNKRRENIATDEMLRTGKQTRNRRSDYIEWNYNSELVAFAARLGENFDDSKLREAFISTDFVEAETKRQIELQIEVNFSPMLPKLFRTYPHREEDWGMPIAMASLFL